METLFRATQFETRFSLNMNVLDADRTPRVMGLKEALRSWLDHRHVVLVRRTEHRLAAIARRLEILDGYLIVYLNLDEVIRIVREEDEPKQALMATFGLTDIQADAVLNMRLRSLRKLEEMEIRREHKKLTAEQKKLQGLLKSEAKRWDTIAEELEATRAKFGDGALGTRRTETGRVLPAVLVDEAAFVEKEPITVILSDKGWIRAQKGHLPPETEHRFKEGDSLHTWVHALFDGPPRPLRQQRPRLHDQGRRDPPRPRRRPARAPHGGTGERGRDRLPVRPRGGPPLPPRHRRRQGLRRRGPPTSWPNAAPASRCWSSTPAAPAMLCVPAEGDTVAAVGENRKLLLFPLDQVPEMARGRGVQLQSYRDGGLSDAKVFNRKDGLSWRSGERTRLETDLAPWRGNRAGAGRMPPNGFPRSNRFGD